MITGLFSALSIILGIVAVIGPIGTIAAVILAPAVALPLISRLASAFFSCKVCVIVTSFVVASVISFWIGHHEAYQKGVDDTVAKVARNDAQLVGRAKAARSKLLDCQQQNMAWDQTTGKCR